MWRWALLTTPVTWPPLPLVTYSFSPFQCSRRWNRSHTPSRRDLSAPFRHTRGRWGSRTQGAAHWNSHSTCRSVSRGAWSFLWSACKGLRTVRHLALGLRANKTSCWQTTNNSKQHTDLLTGCGPLWTFVLTLLLRDRLFILYNALSNFASLTKIFSVGRSHQAFGRSPSEFSWRYGWIWLGGLTRTWSETAGILTETWSRNLHRETKS